MKKIHKNIIVSTISIITCASIATGVIVPMVYNSNPMVENSNNLVDKNKIFNKNTDIIFNDNYYLNVKHATDSLLSSNQVGLNEELYIGDLSNAIVDNNNYNMVNTKKLDKYDTNKEIKKAYKTSLGTYTDDPIKAKKSMIANKETIYLDHEFNAFRSENRAKDQLIQTLIHYQLVIIKFMMQQTINMLTSIH